jgi:uncharacterized protein (TIGR03067 family)
MTSRVGTHGVREMAAVVAGALLTTVVAALFVASVGVVLAQSGPALTATVEHDRSLVAGVWRVDSIEVNGTTNSSDDVRKITTENRLDGGWRLLIDGNEIAAGTSCIDPAESPKTIDLEFTSGSNAGQTSYGIYEAGEKSRRICFAEAGRPRPSDFSTGEGSGRIMVMFERVEAER